MSKRIFTGRSRAHTTSETISNPTLTSTDALPRSDLRTLGSATDKTPESKRSRSRDAAERTLPRTPGPPSKEVAQKSPPPAFDFQLSPPRMETTSNDDDVVSDPTIGVALGSPSFAPPPLLPPPPIHSQHATHLQAVDNPFLVNDTNEIHSPLKHRPSKWKKFGNLFKAKQALNEPAATPFYQLRLDASPGQHPQRESIDQSPQHNLRRDAPWADNGAKVSTKSPPRSFPREALWTESHVKNADSGNGRPWTSGAPTADRRAGSEDVALSPTEAPILTVDIPSIQMERYSVMFGSLLGKTPTSLPSLLDRRSKALGKLSIQEEESDALAYPKPPQRRATSPTPSKSPGFTLFPPTPQSKAERILGSQTLPRGPSPLARARTAPVSSHVPQGSSSSARINERIRGSPSVSTSSTVPSSRPGSQSSFLSSGSDGSDTIDGETIVVDMKPTFTPNRDQFTWEMATPPKAAALKAAALKGAASKTTPQRTTLPSGPSPKTPSSKKKGPSNHDISPLRTSPPILRASSDRIQEKSQIRPTTPIKNDATKSLDPSPFLSPRERVDQLMLGTNSGPAAKAKPPARSRRNPGVRQPSSSHTPTEEQFEDMNAVEVSIARQISVSRRQQMLIPIITRDRLRPDERFVEKKPQTPTLIQGQQHGHRYGKSQDVLIETA